jgi:hypothetical protein
LSRNLIVAALAVLAQGCQPQEQGLGNIPEATASQDQEAMPNPVPRASGTRLSYRGVGVAPRQGAAGGAAAVFHGLLSRLGGCLVVTAPNGTRVQPVFPAGKADWDEASGVLIFEGKSYRPGDRIEIGGGVVASPSAYARETGVEIVPCAERNIWAVIA